MGALLVVDSRENALIVALTADDTMHEVQQMDVGDAVIVLQEGVLGLIVERKTEADLAASMRDGRYHEQKGRLMQVRDKYKYGVVYILEGPRDKKILPDATRDGMIMHTTLRDQIPVIVTADVGGTANWLTAATAFLAKQEKGVVGALTADLSAGQVKKTTNASGVYLRQLCNFMNVGQMRAAKIAMKYPTMARLVAAAQDGSLAVSGVPAKVIAEISEALN